MTRKLLNNEVGWFKIKGEISTLNKAKVLEPIRKDVEPEESVVIQGAVGGHRACGQGIIVGPPIVGGFATRAT